MSQPGTSRPLRMPGFLSPIRRLSLQWTSAGLDPRGQIGPHRRQRHYVQSGIYHGFAHGVCLHRQLHQKVLEPFDASDHYGKWRVVRARVVALRGRWRKVGAAPGPTDPIASEEGGSPWSGGRHGCPSHSLRAYVGVPVNGACSTMRVRDNVSGGGELHTDWKPEHHVRLVLSNSATSSLSSI